MSPYHAAQLVLLLGIVGIATPLLGSYMANVFQGRRTWLHPVIGWLERVTYRVAGIQAEEEMSWKDFAKALLLFNLCGFLVLFGLQLSQSWMPCNPQHLGAVSWPLAFNTAISFVTNTNWQAYSGENTLSYFTQMVGLTVQNFLSAATGMSTFLALARGVARHSAQTIGNCWVDITRCVLYVLLPLSLVLALALVSTGVVQTLASYVPATGVEERPQILPLGPVASQVAIKQLGTNGGGFFGANSAHPFENPNGLSNFLELLAIFLLPSASVFLYGKMVGHLRHCGLLYLAMTLLWLGGVVIATTSESLVNPVLASSPVLEGKETRLGNSSSLLWTVSTTATANGSVNAMLSSLSPLAGGVALFNIMLGELIFGGIGVGMTAMILFSLLTVFLSGLMVGRTPEYLGKKIETREMQWTIVSLLLPSALVLLGAGLSCCLPNALASLSQGGPHGLSELLYAFTSCAGNNGSSFAGLQANTPYYNLLLGAVMFLARGAAILPCLAIGGLLANKQHTPLSVGTFSTDTPLFAILLLSVILIVGALSFFPSLALGPIVEQLAMVKGQGF